MRKRSTQDTVSTILSLIIIIAGILYLVILVASAPEVEPYDNYDLITYNCLDIALETQEWYLINGIETIVYVGCFNESLCHAWLEDIRGNKIIGYAYGDEFIKVYTLDEFNKEFD